MDIEGTQPACIAGNGMRQCSSHRGRKNDSSRASGIAAEDTGHGTLDRQQDMKKKPFHVIRCAGIEFTQDEWSTYLSAVYKGERERITATFGKYTFNDSDICMNPDKQELTAKAGAYGYYITLKWAECGNGLWSFGIDYNLGKGVGGYGVSWADITGNDKSMRNGYPSEKECKLAGWRKALTYIKSHGHNARISPANKLKEMINDEIKKLTRQKIVQLSLFDF